MAYTKTTWGDGTTAITATRLNNIETGVEEAHDDIVDKLHVGEVASDASSITGYNVSGWTASKLGTGRYQVTFSGFWSSSYRVVLTPREVGGLPVFASIEYTSTHLFTVQIHDANGVSRDTNFFFFMHRTA